MILEILLLMIVLGSGIFIVSQAIDRHQEKLGPKKCVLNVRHKKRSRRQIEKDLDWLLLQKRQDVIDEKEFCNQADQLIDELVDSYHIK